MEVGVCSVYGLYFIFINSFCKSRDKGHEGVCGFRMGSGRRPKHFTSMDIGVLSDRCNKHK